MKLVADFYNKAITAIKTAYFANETQTPAKVNYAAECFSNGVLTYGGLINRLSANIKASKPELHNLIKPYIKDFTGYVYDPNEVNVYEGLEIESVHSDCDEFCDINKVTITTETGEKVIAEFDGDYFEFGGIEYRLTYPDCCGFWFFEAIEPSEDEDFDYED